MLRAASVVKGSAVAEQLYRTPLHTGTADWDFTVSLPQANRVELMGWGWAISALTGTNVIPTIRRRASNGMDGSLSLLKALAGPFHSDVITGPTLTAAGWRAYRASAVQRNLWMTPGGVPPGANDAETTGDPYVFDDKAGIHVMLSLNMTAITVFEGYGWMQLRVHNEIDEVGNADQVWR